MEFRLVELMTVKYIKDLLEVWLKIMEMEPRKELVQQQTELVMQFYTHYMDYILFKNTISIYSHVFI